MMMKQICKNLSCFISELEEIEAEWNATNVVFVQVMQMIKMQPCYCLCC